MSKITFKNLTDKDKKLVWSSKKNKDDSHEVVLTFDYNKEIVFSHVPSQYVKEDGEIVKENLNEEESQRLIDARIKSLLNQIQQALFTVKFYGGNIEGFLSSKNKDKNEK